jgi:hypothetical protein
MQFFLLICAIKVKYFVVMVVVSHALTHTTHTHILSLSLSGTHNLSDRQMCTCTHIHTDAYMCVCTHSIRSVIRSRQKGSFAIHKTT